MTTFQTVADAMTAPSRVLATGLPQLDRVAPLGPGQFGVLVGASGTGKSRVASHIARTVQCTREHGVLVITEATTCETLDSSLGFQQPALLVVDPILSLVTEPLPEPDGDRLADQHDVHPAELGLLAQRLHGLARYHQVPVLACHRYTPIRDTATGQIVSTEAAINPLMDAADFVCVVRVLPEPTHLGLEIIRNRTGRLTMLRVPFASH
jgi:ABC-type dipeptide/oligopeptide/nickel transport system ATPase component